MKRSLKSRLILTYLTIALIIISIVVLVIRLTSDQSLMDMVVDQQVDQLSETVIRFYQANGGLEGFSAYYTATNYNPAPQTPPNDYVPPPSRKDLRGLTGLVDANFRAIIPMPDYSVGAIVPQEFLQDVEEVRVDNTTIAYIIKEAKPTFAFNPVEERYVQRTNLAIGLAALVGVVTAVLLGTFFASSLIKPIRKLTEASASLAQGKLGQQVPVTSEDELGQLTKTFNQMSSDLVLADEERKRMTADITHDLSTPLQIISGYIEMVEDGEAQLTPDRIAIIKSEIGHLRRMVSDLTTLSQAEAGGLEIQKALIDPNVLMESVYQAYLPIAARQGVRLELFSDPTATLIDVDEGRMIQVLKNLVENALRYTPVGGDIKLTTHITNNVELWVSDTGMGIEAEDLPHVFERFYQADKARSASKGKMGLGLAICKALVLAQGCQISAHSGGKEQGSTFVISIGRS